ncbi:MAG: hypothetical protein CMM08_03805 [Rhodospirillaceae bacterium]|nr:hypothetical protein [Rhodospirillaceae bacterium]
MTNPEHERARALEQHKAGDLEAAEAVYRGLLAANPEDGRTCGLLGLMRLQQGRAPEARELLERACRLVPEEAKHHNNLGNAELALGRPEAADKAFSRAVEGQPGEADFHVNAATAKLACGAHEAAIAGFQRALEIEADNFRAQHNLGSLLSRHNRVAEALPHLEAAAAHSACQAETLVNLASAYDRDNRLDEAEAVLARIPDDAPLPPPIQVFLIILRARHRRRRHDADGALGLLMPLEAHFASGANPELAADFHHELGRAADLAGDSARAFAAFLATKHCLAAADPEAASSSYLTQVRERRRTRPRVATAAARAADPTLAFFVGFPRSGTTLLEAMLDAHPGTLTTAEAGLIGAVEQCLEGAGDDLTEHAGQARKAYFSALAEHFGEVPAGTTVVDKLPLNLSHCRLLDALFPEARLLVALRDPRDVVLSCLMQRFLPNQAMRELDTLDDAVTLYEEVMGLWLEARDALAMPWLEYRYEDLVADPQATLSSILDFLGLDAEADLADYREKAADRGITTPSYLAVQAPINPRAIGRWRAYQGELAPALERLAPFAQAFGYD